MSAMMDAGAQRNRYQVVLSGELMPGHDLDQALTLLAELFTAPPSQLRNLFDGASRPVQQALSADDALDLQSRLQRAGVRAHVERMTGQDLMLELRHPPGATKPAADPRSREPSVVRAGQPTGPVDRPDREAAAVAAADKVAADQAAPVPRAKAAPKTHAEQRWYDAWADSHVEDEPDENERLGAFIGPAAPAYLKRFQRVRLNNRPTLAPSWNWGAVASPFLWALYRKMWVWALVIGMTEIVLPVVLLILAKHGVLPAGFAQVAYLSVIANRLFWPAVADYLYYRYTHFSLLRLFRMQPGYASDLDIATTGGISRSAVLVGLAFSGVFALFVWSLVSSIAGGGPDPFEARVSAMSRQQDLTRVQTPGEILDESRSKEEENRWSLTRRKLRELGQTVSNWTSRQSTSKDPSQLNLYRLRQEMEVPAEALKDGWGNEVQYLPDNEGYRLISAGPDQLFGTADDIVYQRVLSR